MKDLISQEIRFLKLNKPAHTKEFKFDEVNESSKIGEANKKQLSVQNNRIKHLRVPMININRVHQRESPTSGSGLFMLPDISSKFNKKSIASYFSPSKTPIGVNTINPPDILDPRFKEYETKTKVAKYEKDSMIDQLQKETNHYNLKKKDRNNFDSWLNEVIN